jgi:DNA-directed RNA polymerase specialized sigma24 family protein
MALAALPPRMRAVVVLRYWLDYDVRETAAVLGCSEGTVKSQSKVGLDRLRLLLPPAGGGGKRRAVQALIMPAPEAEAGPEGGERR